MQGHRWAGTRRGLHDPVGDIRQGECLGLTHPLLKVTKIEGNGPTSRICRTPFTQAGSWMGCDQKGPPMIQLEPVSGHCWGTVGPCPGAYLKPFPLGDCTAGLHRRPHF